MCWSLFRKWRFLTIVVRSLVQKLLVSRKLTFFKFKLFSHGEQSFRDYSVFFVVLTFCDLHKIRLSVTSLKTENVVIFA